jgi:hypothetical protein
MPFISTILAQNVGPTTTVNLTAPANFTGLQNITVGGAISWAVNVILVVAGLVFFFMLILGGIRWIMSGGDKAGTESARSQVTAALIGLVVVFSAWALATLIGSVFGVNIIGNFDLGAIIPG